MPVLRAYDQFDGRHWETGSVRNALAFQGFRAPHSSEPYSEALLLGVSGGVAVGYFSFAYEGYDPQARILTRNTFDPWDTMLSRLGVVQSVQQTAKPDAAARHLHAALDDGLPPIVWADQWSLPYNGLAFDAGWWAMLPVLVYGVNESADTVWIADRAQVGLTCTTAELAAARGRAKNAKYRLITLSGPLPEKLPVAVAEGIDQCLRLYTEPPPKGTRDNFGLAALRNWAALLTKPKARLSWERVFPAGPKFYAGLTSAFHDIAIFGKAGGAERDVYADFLVEAAAILERPGLAEAAAAFRGAARAWDELGRGLLPDDVEPFGEARRLMLESHRLFLDGGNATLAERLAIRDRLDAIRAAMDDAFPLTQPQVEALRSDIAARVMTLHDREAEAVELVRAALA